MSPEVRLIGVELVAFARSHDLCGISDSRGLVETLAKHITHEGAWRRVMTANSGVDVPKQLPALGNRNATLQNSRGAMLVQLFVDHNKRLGLPGDASHLSAIRG